MFSQESSTEQLRRAAALCRELTAALDREHKTDGYLLKKGLLDRSSDAGKTEPEVLKKDIFVASQVFFEARRQARGRSKEVDAMVPDALKTEESGRILYEVDNDFAGHFGFVPIAEIKRFIPLCNQFLTNLHGRNAAIEVRPVDYESEIALYKDIYADDEKEMAQVWKLLAENVIYRLDDVLRYALSHHLTRTDILALLPEELTTPESLKVIRTVFHGLPFLLDMCREKLKPSVAEEEVVRVASLCQAFAEAIKKEWGEELPAPSKRMSGAEGPGLRYHIANVEDQESEAERQFRFAARPIQATEDIISALYHDTYTKDKDIETQHRMRDEVRTKILSMMPAALKTEEVARVLHVAAPGSYIANFAGPPPLDPYRKATKAFYK